MNFAAAAAAALVAWALAGPALAVGWTATLPSGQGLNIVEGATATRSGYFLERRYPDGVRDPQFGSAGRAFFSMGSDNSPPASLSVDAQGRILVTGTAPAEDGRGAAAVLRFLPAGQVDNSWGQQGRSLGAAPGADAAAVDLVTLSDGGVLVLGTVDEEQTQRAALWRFDGNGQLDPGFAKSGLLVAGSLPQSQGLSIQQGPDGTLHIAVQVGRADKLWLEVHRWKPGEGSPQRIARQEFPEDWVGPALLTQRGAGWVWVDASQPLTAPLELKPVTPDSPWTNAVVTLQTRPPEGPATSGHAALNPFSEGKSGGTDGTILNLDDFAWPAALLAAVLLLGGAWWWRRRD